MSKEQVGRLLMEVRQTMLNEILPLRRLFLEENQFQIRYDARHARGWTDSYVITDEGVPVGYGSIMGHEQLTDRDTVFEFFLLPSHRQHARQAFLKLVDLSKAIRIETQSNEKLLTSLLQELGDHIRKEVILFRDHSQTNLVVPEVIFRKRKDSDVLFDHHSEPVGDFVLDCDGEVVATGGFLLHYNFPFADLFMEVKETHRRKGLGSFLIQEVKKACHAAGRVPAARCDIENEASKSTLMKAGFEVAGYMLSGLITK